MQDAIMGIGVNCMDGNDDVDIWQELDDLMAVDAPADAFVAAEQRAEEAAAERREADRAAKVDTSTLMSA
jgi:hypothetical protein